MRIHAFHRLFQHRLSLSTKPFNARGAKVERCQYCQVSLQHCLCAHQPDVESGVAVLLLVSDNEVFKPSNTGRLIADTVKETYVYQWNRTEPDSEIIQLLQNERYQPMVIFPDSYVEDQSRLLIDAEAYLVPSKTPLLILLDGSWREARRMFRKSPYLNGLPVLSVTPDVVSQYMMRRSDNDTHLSTVEVAAMVLEQIGEQATAKTLSLWFEAFRESYLLSKTRFKHDLSKPALKRFLEHK
ncbi:tRNA-uridine aminocarboxypropyltransferase [Vibrio proteolyticus]